MDLFARFHLDWYEWVGLAGETLFFLRMVVMWNDSERARKPVVPITFWYMSLAGAALMTAYAFLLGRLAILLPNLGGGVLFARSLQLELRHRARSARLAGVGFERPDYDWPSVSVIVPVRNEAELLADTLTSLLEQMYPRAKYEVIVALNGCTDGSRAVAAQFPVRIVDCATEGKAAGRNAGAAVATGDLLLFVDADTTLPVQGIRTIVEEIHGKGRIVGTVAVRPDRGGPGVRLGMLWARRQARGERAPVRGGVVVTQRAVFEDLGGFRTETADRFFLEAQERGAAYVCIDECVATTSAREIMAKGIFPLLRLWRVAREAAHATSS